MKTLMRADIRRALKTDKFWLYFPEYEYLKPKVLRSGCCSMKEELYQEVLSLVKKSPTKWKSYFNEDKLQLFDGKKTLIL